MDNDIQKMIEDARAQRAAEMGEMVANAIYFTSIQLTRFSYWVGAKLLNVFEQLGKLSDQIAQSAARRDEETFFAGSTSLADLENRMKYFERTHQTRF